MSHLYLGLITSLCQFVKKKYNNPRTRRKILSGFFKELYEILEKARESVGCIELAKSVQIRVMINASSQLPTFSLVKILIKIGKR